MNQKEWFDRCVNGGTSGDMVMDILDDWKKENEKHNKRDGYLNDFQEQLDAFVEKNGTIQDWEGDREKWYAALGAFVSGWCAHRDYYRG